MIPNTMAHPATTIAIIPSDPKRNRELSLMVSTLEGRGPSGLVGVGLMTLVLVTEGTTEGGTEVGTEVGLREGEGDTMADVAGASEVLGTIDVEGEGATLVAGGTDVALIRGKEPFPPPIGSSTGRSTL
jgi:hypothetical protein